MNSKLKKAIKWSVALVVFLGWMILSPVAFHIDKRYEEVSPDKKYKIVAYNVMPTTPIAFFQAIFNSDIFLVLYDSNGKYLGQSSPFHFSYFEIVFGGEIFFPNNQYIEIKDEFSILGAGDYVDGYTIPVGRMKWWSRILSVFY